MQKITIYRKDTKDVLYQIFDENNGKYLEREENQKFKFLSLVDDCSNTVFAEGQDLSGLIQELKIVSKEAKNIDDIKAFDHINKIIAACEYINQKSEGLVIEFSPWGELSNIEQAKFEKEILSYKKSKSR